MKAFVVTTGMHAEALQRRLAEKWIALSIGQATLGLRLDDVVIAEDFSRHEYTSAPWMDMRRGWYETLRTRMTPDAGALRLTSPPA
jgi:hypothetical protein